ncbi:MAG: hypothetical protein RBR82_17065, partial [Pseudomonas sp.]|nr:hypothetical protein [Pseudomonas sp.]
DSAMTDATNPDEDKSPVKDQNKLEESQSDGSDSVTKPDDSEVITPPDSSETIVLPDGEEDSETGIEAPEDNESELVIAPPQSTATETTDQEAPVPITAK